MGFDADLFMKTDFQPRTEAVPVPDLAAWFGGDRKAARWTVRGLTGAELARVNEAQAAAKDLAAIAEGIVSPEKREKVDALRKLLGLADDVPAELVRRIEMLEIASVEPTVDRAVLVKLAANYPVEFYQLTNAITRLTGEGHVPGKAGGSGETPASESPS